MAHTKIPSSPAKVVLTSSLTRHHGGAAAASSSSSLGGHPSSASSEQPQQPQYFDNAQRTKQLSWGVWCFKHFLLLSLKFCVAGVFYTIHRYAATTTSSGGYHYYSHSSHSSRSHSSKINSEREEEGTDDELASPVLQSQLQAFRRESRTSRHERVLRDALRSRQRADRQKDGHSGGQSGEHRNSGGGELHGFVWDGGEDDPADNDMDNAHWLFRTKEYVWRPPLEKCGALSGGDHEDDNEPLLDPFPDSFDAVYYRSQSSEMVSGTEQETQQQEPFDYGHWLHYGRANGWPCSRGPFVLRDRDSFAREIAHLIAGDRLEIGPFLHPWLVAQNNNNQASNSGNGSGAAHHHHRKVDYFDVADYPTLHEAAVSLNYPPTADAQEEIDINYVHPRGDLLAVLGHRPEAYSLVASRRVLGVVPDLVRHLRQVGYLLRPGGYYTLLVPDKRFSRDHFATESTIADVLEVYHTSTDEDAFAPQNSQPTLRSLIESRALQVPTNNGADETWHGEHGFPYEDASDPQFLEKLRAAIDEFERQQQPPSDSNSTAAATVAAAVGDDALRFHQFTPQGLAFIVDALHALGHTELRVHRLYETVQNSDEFGIVLQKCTPANYK